VEEGPMAALRARKTDSEWGVGTTKVGGGNVNSWEWGWEWRRRDKDHDFFTYLY